jgi:hypothetical protein
LEKMNIDDAKEVLLACFWWKFNRLNFAVRFSLVLQNGI